MAARKKTTKAKGARTKVKKKPVKKKTAARKVKRKVGRRKPVAKRAKAGSRPTKISPSLQTIGEVTHYFPHVSAGVIKLTGVLKVGDIVHIKGHTTDFKQTVNSMQINHVVVNEAKRGAEIGVKVQDRVRIGDTVYKL